MSVKVKIPTQLRSLTDGHDEVEVQASTVKDMIDELERSHPGIGTRLLDDAGQLRRFVNVYLNDEDVRFLSGLSTVVPEQAVVSIIPAVAGGA